MNRVPVGAPEVRIGSLVIDCVDLERLVAFWSAALGYTPGERLERFVRLDDPAGRVNLSLQRVEAPPRPSPLHLDLYTQDQPGEVRRLQALGARHVRGPAPGTDFVVLEDPEGNRFCVVEKPGA